MQPLMFTYVEYDPSDLLSHFFAVITLAPIYLIVGVLAVILTRREIRACTLVLGLTFNECVNYTLKHAFAQPRPPPPHGSWFSPVGYGMPSSHAQMMAFFAVWIIYLLERKETKLLMRWENLIIHLSSVFLPLLVAVSRVYLGVHTYWQVIVGLLVGLTTGLLWVALERLILRDFLLTKAFLSSRASTFLSLKDSAVMNIPLLQEAENMKKWVSAESS